jgi:hypothetical protein
MDFCRRDGQKTSWSQNIEWIIDAIIQTISLGCSLLILDCVQDKDNGHEMLVLFELEDSIVFEF